MYDMHVNSLKRLPSYIQGRYLAFAILAISLGWILITPMLFPQPPTSILEITHPGFQAPGFNLQTINRSWVDLKDQRGKTIILNIWASWCSPCQAEMPALQRIYERYQGAKFEILAVNSTFQDDPTAAEKFALSKSLTFPILLDVEGTVTRLYQVKALPTTIFIRPDGVIHEIIIGGPLSEAVLASKIEEIQKGFN